MNQTPRIPWDASIWFFDIDDTLIDTEGATVAASEGIQAIFALHFGEEKAKEIQATFNSIFSLLLSGYRLKHEEEWRGIPGGKAGFDELLHYIEARQVRVKESCGHIKLWSREVLIALSAERAGIDPSAELLHEAGDAYWVAMSQQTSVFPDARELLAQIRRHNRPVFLATSSDARLKMAADGQFEYDPSYSEALKRERIELVRQKGVSYDALSIGDPEDKPNRDFFEKAVRSAEAGLGHPIDPAYSLMIGDSFAGDLQTPKEKMGFGLVGLIDRKAESRIIDGQYVVVNDLTKLAEYLV